MQMRISTLKFSDRLMLWVLETEQISAVGLFWNFSNLAKKKVLNTFSCPNLLMHHHLIHYFYCSLILILLKGFNN